MKRTEKSKANGRQERSKANGRQEKSIANGRQGEPKDCKLDKDEVNKAKYEENTLQRKAAVSQSRSIQEPVQTQRSISTWKQRSTRTRVSPCRRTPR